MCDIILNSDFPSHIFSDEYNDKNKEIYVKIYFCKLLIDLKNVMESNISNWPIIVKSLDDHISNSQIKFDSFNNGECNYSMLNSDTIYYHIKNPIVINSFVKKLYEILEPYYIVNNANYIHDPILIDCYDKLIHIESLLV